MFPYQNPSVLNRSLGLLKNISWGSLLDGTQKTLGVINQAIPIVYQVKPIFGNMKTLFKIANVIKDNDDDSYDINSNIEESTKVSINNNLPVFYI